MAPLSYLLPTLAAAGIAYAANCGSSNPVTIQNQGDASSELGSCTTYQGSVTIQSNYAQGLDLGSLREITGDFTFSSAPNITGISGNSLETIGGKFGLNDGQTLASLVFPKLTSVGSIEFTGLPNLNTLNWQGPLKKADTLRIENTFLQSLDGINLQNVKSINIANNKLLQSISFQVTSLSGNIIITNNGDRLETKFPNLETAQNITFRNVPSVAIPSLKNVTGSLGFYDNTFAEINGVNLTLIKGTLAINGNTKLTNVSLPALKEIDGGFQVQNNTILDSVNFPALQTVAGAVDFYGAFTDVEFPALKDVRGGFNVQSSGDIDKNCNTFKSQSGSSNVIKGKYQCVSKANAPGNANTNGGGSSSGKKNSASGYSRSSSLSTLGLVIAGVFALL